MTRQRLLLVAGGTGGHIFPALAFGMWVSRTYGDVDVSYMCGSREMEREIYRSAGVEPFSLSASGSPLGASRGQGLLRCRELLASFIEARGHLREFAPHLCVIFGGYVSLPALLLSRMGHTRIVAHEQNAYAGRITRLASKMGVPVASGWASCEPLRKTAYSNTGIPVRLFRRMERREAWHELEIPVERSARQTVLVMTGSLGSEGIRSVMSSVCRDARMQDWTCLIVGAAGDVTERVAENAFLLPKRWDASPFFSAADVAITRGGASTLSEVAAMDLPSVVIPWRGASDDHQMKNAQCFAMDHKSIVWDEKSGQIDDLVKNLNDLCRFSRAQSGLSNKKMYNATESTCAKLWRLLIPCEKGEIHVGGR